MPDIDDLLSTVWVLLDRPLVLAALVVGGVLLGAGALLGARRYGWRQAPALLAGLGAALVLALTLPRHRPDFAATPGVVSYGEPFCILDGVSVTGGQELLNVLLFMPFALFAVIATHRPMSVFVVSVVSSAGIELTQTLTGQGICETQDFLHNAIGIAVATVLGAAVNTLIGSDRRVVLPDREPARHG
ncbi:VanZ family protein [Actinokineospora sp. PR83]|uniref:VanZ family protein n=1 Tax=Actinokineospora sp. PR83 TaxID=2884908 RepID=UPI001F442C64|nr:VanZ family protein [Actinokineospora sp. PR83]MCG8915706.1 VanZ family protein [Actinokineospora sp. PR83]